MPVIDGKGREAPMTPAASPADPLVGTVIADRYEVLSRVARGGMGSIYKGNQRPLDRPVAIKVIGGVLDGDDSRAQGFQARFLREAATLARLKHPNTVTLFDYGVLPATEQAYMVMEFVDGRTLSRLLRRDGPMPPGRALWIADEVARALAEAHGMGIVHRDLKPSNIMIAAGPEGDQIKVLDFGIARLLGEESQRITRAQDLLGSPSYMSPEQIDGTEVDARSDVYSLGVVLYHLLAGRVPFKGETYSATLVAHLHQRPPSIASLRGEAVPAEVEAIVLRCLEKDPADRYADVYALQRDVREVQARLRGELPARPTPPPPDIPPPPGDAAPEEGAGTAAPEPTLTLSGEPTQPQEDIEDNEPTVERRRPAWGVPLLLVLALLLIAVAIGGAWKSLADGPEPTPGSAATAPEPKPEAATAPESKPEAAAAAPAAAAQVELRSQPSGAAAFDGDVHLGQTPLSVAVERGTPRAIVLRLEGHQPREAALRTSDATNGVTVALQPEPAAAPPPARARRQAPAPERAQEDDMDIRMSR